MADADAPRQQPHLRLHEHVLHQAVALVDVQPVAVHGGDAGRVLATVLQDLQRVVQAGGDRPVADDSDDAAHGLYTSLADAGVVGSSMGIGGSGTASKRTCSATAAGNQPRSHSAPRWNPGRTRDCCHHGSCGNGVKPSTSTSTQPSAAPRSRPKPSPSRRSVPDRPVERTSLPSSQVASPPTISASRNSSTYPSNNRAAGESTWAANRAEASSP